MKVSLIMATAGRRDEIYHLLDSLDRQSSSDFELIIVDQNVEGFLDPIIQRLSRSTVAFKHIKTDRRGLSIARNLGFLHAAHGIIGYPDDDCWYEEDVIARVLASFKTDPSQDGLIARWVERDRNLTKHTLNRESWRQFRTGISGSSISLFARRELVHAVGGFDESLGVPMWIGAGEEIDFTMRCLDQGARMVYTLGVRIHHPVKTILDGTLKDMLQRTRNRSRGSGALYRKHKLSWAVVARGLASPVINSVIPPYSFRRLLANLMMVIGRFEGMLAWNGNTVQSNNSKRVPLGVLLTVVLSGCLTTAIPGNAERLIPLQDPIPRTFFGLHIHRAASTTTWPIASFGSWHLVDAHVNWFNLQPDLARWNFETLDRYVTLSTQNNVEMLLPLAYPPRWASSKPPLKGPYGDGTGAPPLLMYDWRAYVTQVGTRYKGKIHYYDVWDEPNEKVFFSGTQEELVSLVREAYLILKRIDPKTQLVSPGLVGAIEWLDLYLQKGGAAYADIIGYHFYPPLGGPDKHAQQRPESMIDKVRQVKEVMKKNGISNKPLWNTGIGYWNRNSDGTPESMVGVDSRWIRLDPDLASAWVARTYILGWAVGMERVFWYSWDHENMGLIEPTSKTMKPAGKAYMTIMNWLIGSTMKYCHNDKDSLWVCEITRPGDRKAWIVWRAVGTQSEPLPAAWHATIYRTLNGESKTLDSPSSPILINEQPVLIQSDYQAW